MKVLVFLFGFLLATSCQKKLDQTDSSLTGIFQSGDIVVSNTGTKSVLLFDSAGTFKRTLYTAGATSGETPYGLVYNSNAEALMILLDGTADKVVSVARSDGSINENYILDANLNSGTGGRVRAITQLTGGDLLIGEDSAIERFTYNGARVTSDTTSGAWPKTGGTIPTLVLTQFYPLSNGGIAVCSTGTDVIRTFDNTMTQVGSAASGIAGTTDTYGCAADSSGGLFAVFNGTTDTVRKYTASDLGSPSWSYSNTTVLPNPVSLAVRSSGNVLVVDATNNWVIELSSSGSYVDKVGGGGADINSMLSTPNTIYVIP